MREKYQDLCIPDMEISSSGSPRIQTGSSHKACVNGKEGVLQALTVPTAVGESSTPKSVGSALTGRGSAALRG